MKDCGKPGKRKGPVGYRTASAFLHKKCAENARVKRRLNKSEKGKSKFG